MLIRLYADGEAEDLTYCSYILGFFLSIFSHNLTANDTPLSHFFWAGIQVI